MTSGPNGEALAAIGAVRTDITSDLVPGEAFGRFRLVSVLQRGGMGEICLAEDIENPGHRVVVKRLLEDFVAEEEYMTMFRAEARIMSQLRHPNIVEVLETPVVRGTLCLVLELVPGRNVAQVLQEVRNQAVRIPPNVALHIMIEALRGLHYAHTAVDEAGVPLELVHRDVSPGNLLVSYDGRVKVTDFGIAKSRLSVLATSVGVVKGTTRYLSPEQVRGGAVTPRSDLFACAAVLVEMLTGKALFDRGQVPPTLLAIVKGHRRPISELLPFTAPDLALVLERALALAPSERFESAAAMADALEAQRPALGSVVGPEALGAYLTRLFPDHAPPADPGPSGPFGASYLLETDEEGVALGATDVQRSMSGAKPLDASEFEDPDAPTRTPARPFSRPVPAFAPGRVAGPVRPREEETPTEAAPKGRSVSFVDEVEAAALELSEAERARPPGPPPPPPPSSGESEPGVSDSAVEADAFQLSDPEPVVRPSRFSTPSFVGGVVVGGALVFAATTFFGAPPPAPSKPSPPPVVVAAPVRLTPPPPPPRVPPPIPPVETASTATAAASETSGAVVDAGARLAEGYITLRRPRRARVLIDGVRIDKRVPLIRYPVPAGHLRVEIKKRRFHREVELDVREGQHLDVSRAEIRVLEEGGPEAGPAGDQ